MQNGVNKVLLVGNLTADPQIIPTKIKTGTSMSPFVAVNRGWKNKDGEKVSKPISTRWSLSGTPGNQGTYLKRWQESARFPDVLKNGSCAVTKDGSKRYTMKLY